MRALLLTLAACSWSAPRPERAESLALDVRYASARHAAETSLGVYVWPSAPPPDDLGPDDEACRWWQGTRDARPFAHKGLRDGFLRWGAIEIGASTLRFAGERVVDLQDGALPRGQELEALAPLATALAEARHIQDAWYDVCGTVYRDRPLLAIDADTPVQTLRYVLDTASTLRFPRVAALVSDPKAARRPPMDPDDPGSLVVVRQTGRSMEVFSPAADRRVTGPIDELEPMIATALDGERYGCTMIVARAGTRWEELAATLDSSQAFRTHSNFVHFDDHPGQTSPAPERYGQLTERLNSDLTAPVLWMELPVLAWRDTDAVQCDAVTSGGRGREAPLPEALELALEPAHDEVTVRSGLPRGARPSRGERIGLRAIGPVQIGTPDAPAEPLVPVISAAIACADEAAERSDAPDEVALGFQVHPDGSIHSPFTASFRPSDPIHACLASALEPLDALPAPGEHRYATVFLGVSVR